MARLSQEARVRIAGGKQHEPAATGTAAEATEAGAGARRSARRRQMWIILGVVAVLLIVLSGFAAYVLTREDNATAGANVRPSGIPQDISTSLANLMQLSPIPGARAPGFTLTDQRGHTMSLASLRGKVVVLEFMDPHCTDICPIVSQEFVDAYRKLGEGGRRGHLLRRAAAEHDPELAFLHRPGACPAYRVARLQHRGRGTQAER